MRDSVSMGYPNTKKRFENTIHSVQSILDKVQGVWIAKETLSQAFDVSSELKQKLSHRTKGRSEIVKVYAN